MSRALIAVLLSCFVSVAGAQNGSEYLFWHLGTANGLLSDDILGTQQDDQGYLWIATLNGLQRYDGKRFTNFRHVVGDPHSIPSDRIVGIKLDGKKRLWLVFGGNRVGYMSIHDFVFHEVTVRYNEDTLKKTNNSIALDNAGHVYFILHHVSILTYDEERNEFSESFGHIRWPKGWRPLMLLQDKREGNYWITCMEGLVKYNPLRQTLSYRGHNADNDAVIKAFEPLVSVALPVLDQSNRFWLISWPPTGGLSLLCYDPATGRTGSYAADLGRQVKGIYFEIHSIVEQADGSIWAVGPNMFARMGKKDSSFQVIPDNLPGQYSIRYDGIETLTEDREHNLWVCSNKGLYRFNPNAMLFHTIGNRRYGKDTVYSCDVNGVLHTREGHILVYTWGCGIYAYDKDFTPLNLPYVAEAHRQSAAFLWCMYQRDNGDIWVGSQEGYLFIMHPSTGKCDRLRDPIFGGSTVRQITPDSLGNLWFGMQNGSVVKWSVATDRFSKIHRFNGPIQRLTTDQKGNIWACTDKDGLYGIDPYTDSISVHYSVRGPAGKVLLGVDVKDIIQYQDSLYIIAADGLNILNTHTGLFRYFTSDNGLPSNTILSMVMDKAGYLWAATENGFCSVNLDRHVVVTYSATDGVGTSSFNIAAGGTLRDGRILFGTAHNSLLFDPRKVASDTGEVPPHVTLTGFTLMGRRLNMDSLTRLRTVVLPYDQNSIALQFSTLTYLYDYAVFYRMEGLEDGWTLCRSMPEVVYSYLPPGNYTFKVYSKNASGRDPKQVTELKIRILAPFWKTAWFLSLLGFVIVGVLYYLDKLRMQKLRATESIRARIATSLTEDLGSSLSSINLTSELAKTKVDTDKERTREYIDQISDTSYRMIDSMYDMIWSINPQNDSMQHTVERMKSYATEMESIYGIDIVFDIDKAVYRPEAGMDNRYGLLVVYKEAVLNACRHAKAKHIYVHLSYRNQKLVIAVQDDGKGFDVDAVRLGRGINEMQRRASAMSAQLIIQSEINTGSVVRLEKHL